MMAAAPSPFDVVTDTARGVTVGRGDTFGVDLFDEENIDVVRSMDLACLSARTRSARMARL